MADSQVTFASEEDKIAALDKIPETPENVAEIQKVMDAQVGDTPPASAAKPEAESQEKPETTVTDPAPETPPAEKPAEKADGFIQIPLSELPEEYRSFDNAGKFLKKVKNQDETIARQTQFIRENLPKREQVADEGIETLRRENEELRRKVQTGLDAGKTVAAPTQQQAAASQGRLGELIQKRKALLQKFSDVEDQQFNSEFIKEKTALDDMVLDEMTRLNGALEAMGREVQETKKQAGEVIQSRRFEEQRSQEEKVFTEQVKTIQTFTDTHEEFKLSKPFMEVDKEYREYQAKVASAYWGRLPKDGGEIQQAMEQLQRRSPALLNTLQAAQLPTEPTDDMQRYLATCEVWDAWQGIRKDPLKGDFNRDKNGRVVPLTRWDPISKQFVPDAYPTPESAYNDLQVRGGHYTQKVIEAFKQGGKTAAEARSRRDGGVVEMDNSSGGKPRASADQALVEIEKIDEVQAKRQAMDGDPTMLKRYNDLALIVGWPQI